ncbi:esterase-like activity of phytase family protein [Ramlibacter sp. WS9]|uniref:esterase-like activity of phytase family protein n=1 Tax=Ramlibacter sp. WS9 TaxID=1882741 RepID=UPI0011426FC4|nr:esterase-like activity of phytase family protein [Ramlibacter sp. WS9]ROZ77414.1 esterase-like activity of phytase family protein [Ramlibacter sp. WS9]
MNKNHQHHLIAILAAAALVAACGGSDGPAPVTGAFLDAAVEGVDYTPGSAVKASTNAQGQFTCGTGESVSFTVGGIALGAATCGTVITPQTLANGAGIKTDAVTNRLIALQTLDEDGDPSNGIRLTSAVKTALASRTLDFTLSASSFNAALTATLAVLPEPYKSRAVNDDRRILAREHFENTLASTVGTPVGDTVTQSNGAGTVSATITRYQIQAAKSFYIPYEGSVQKIKDDFPDGFLPAYGSGLAFKSRLADGTLEFYAITDRGPNGDGPKVPNTGSSLCLARADGTCDAKFFPAPSFAPSIGVVTVGAGGAVLKSSMPIRVSANVKATGLPYAAGQLGSSGEAPLTDNIKYESATAATFATTGLDTESIVVDAARNALWVSDEYGPFIVKIDPATGVILKKYGASIPAGSTMTASVGITTVLPSVLAKRRANRGMEGLALEVATGKLHGFLQSPLTDLSAAGAPASGTYVAPAGSGCVDGGTGKRVERYARFARWVEFNPDTETSKMYAYPINCADYQDNRTGNAKLGDMVSLGGGKFIVIEQGAAPGGKVFNKLMLVEIASATDISKAEFNPETSDLEKSSMAGAAVNGSADYVTAVTPLKKTLLLDLNAAGWLAEKAEGLALVDATTLALTNDDDFGLRTLVFDVAGAAIPGADITACTATDGVLSACGTGVTARASRGADTERPNRLWLIKFGKNLADFSVPN